MKYIKNIILDEINEHKTAVNNLNKNKLKLSEFSKKSYIFFACFILFYVWQYFFDTKLYLFAINTLKLSKITYFFIFDFITIIIAFFLFRKEIKEGFNNLRYNLISYIEYFTLTAVFFLIIEALIGLICNLIVGEIPTNQIAIVNISNKFYMLFGTIVFAPIVEEVIFRGIIRRFIKKESLFILFSSLIFGLMHVLGGEISLQYIYVFYYSFSGFYLSYIYAKFNNLTFCILIHFILNLFASLSVL